MSKEFKFIKDSSFITRCPYCGSQRVRFDAIIPEENGTVLFPMTCSMHCCKKRWTNQFAYQGSKIDKYHKCIIKSL